MVVQSLLKESVTIIEDEELELDEEMCFGDSQYISQTFVSNIREE